MPAAEKTEGGAPGTQLKQAITGLLPQGLQEILPAEILSDSPDKIPVFTRAEIFIGKGEKTAGIGRGGSRPSSGLAQDSNGTTFLRRGDGRCKARSPGTDHDYVGMNDPLPPSLKPPPVDRFYKVPLNPPGRFSRQFKLTESADQQLREQDHAEQGEGCLLYTSYSLFRDVHGKHPFPYLETASPFQVTGP